MEKFIIENWVLFAVVAVAVVIILQRSKIRHLERLLVISEGGKSREAFKKREAQKDVSFRGRVISELLREFSDEELVALDDKMARYIRRLSDMKIQDGAILEELDVYRLCREFIFFEIENRKTPAPVF